MLRIDNSVPRLVQSGSPPKTHPPRANSARRGFTLLEVMIATAVTLLMMISLAQIFKVVGDSMRQGRSVLELNSRLRNVVYRIRTDLDNLTVIPNPPADPSQAQGYMQVFDGATTDYTAATTSIAYSRFGDIDDIFMATVRAGDVWFTGKVPQYILSQTEPSNSTDIQLVSIAAQHAEIAIFLQPLVTSDGNPNRDPNYYLTASPQGAVAFEDTDGFDGFPDSFRLHYRTFLIRPDLNLSTALTLGSLNNAVAPAGVLPGGIVGSANWTTALPTAGLPTPLCDMASAHQQCDLSIRRVYGSGGAGFDFVAANSLEDLVDPANRFAHVQFGIPGTNSSTMPLLALGPGLAVNSPFANNSQYVALNEPGNTGFLHPAYTLRGSRAGEDVLASDILAFDIKCFDPSVPLLPSLGSDGAAGVAGIDDDQSGQADDASEFGWAGSDDLVLSPNDPGYANVLGATAVGTGDYVDLCWARKLVVKHLAAGGSIPNGSNLWSQLSGLSASRYSSNGIARGFTDSLYASGYVSGNRSTGAPLVLQPCYDTWTSRYEGDGILQSEFSAREGTCQIDSTDVANSFPAWRQTAIDAATDGIDNNPSVGVGVDDSTEFETSPPFPVALRGLKITVRMEDPRTREVKQMSAAKEFVTQ